MGQTKMTANRSVDLFVVLAFALFGLFIIPHHTSGLQSGWMRSRGEVRIVPKEILRFICILAIAIATLWAISRFGFLAAGPAFVGALMLFVGER